MSVTVPYHNKDIKSETLRSILRQAKLSIDKLIELK
ncbi:MAG: type II toxin-antitoxin system HicA family toxin [Bacteroidota bacterium]|nr:type II toxin-antitoxin system HicA family toxin [Bacteroidota bacterium]